MTDAYIFDEQAVRRISAMVAATKGRITGQLPIVGQPNSRTALVPFVCIDEPLLDADENKRIPNRVTGFNWYESPDLTIELLDQSRRFGNNIFDPVRDITEWPEQGQYEIDISTFYEGVPLKYDRLWCIKIGQQWYAFGQGITFIVDNDPETDSTTYIPDRRGETFAQELWGVNYTPVLQWIRSERYFVTVLWPCTTGL
jgi:hypothetical protein